MIPFQSLIDIGRTFNIRLTHNNEKIYEGHKLGIYHDVKYI